MSLQTLPSELLLAIFKQIVLSDQAQDAPAWPSNALHGIHDALNFSAANKRLRELVSGEMWKSFRIYDRKPSKHTGFWMALATETAYWHSPHSYYVQFPWRNKKLSLNVLKYVRLFTADVNTPVYLYDTSTASKGRLCSQLQLVSPKIMPSLEKVHVEISFVYHFFGELGRALDEYNGQVKLVLALSDFVSLDKLSDYGLLPHISMFGYVFNLLDKPVQDYHRGDMTHISQMKNLEILSLRGFGKATHKQELMQVALEIFDQIQKLPKLTSLRVHGVPMCINTDSMAWMPRSVNSLKWEWLSFDSTSFHSFNHNIFENVRILELGPLAIKELPDDWKFPFRNLQQLCLSSVSPGKANSAHIINFITQNPRLPTLHIHSIGMTELKDLLPHLHHIEHLEITCIPSPNIDEIAGSSAIESIIEHCLFLKSLNMFQTPTEPISFFPFAQAALRSLAVVLIAPAPKIPLLFKDLPSSCSAENFCSEVKALEFCPERCRHFDSKLSPIATRIDLNQLRNVL